jgi:hypothetical protein
MEQWIMENDWKAGWVQLSKSFFYSELVTALAELVASIEEKVDVFSAASKVACFSFMLADAATAGQLTHAGVPEIPAEHKDKPFLHTTAALFLPPSPWALARTDMQLSFPSEILDKRNQAEILHRILGVGTYMVGQELLEENQSPKLIIPSTGILRPQ